jgi:hypothetical protein
LGINVSISLSSLSYASHVKIQAEKKGNNKTERRKKKAIKREKRREREGRTVGGMMMTC